MKKSERSVGFVTYDETIFPFEFIESTFIINLFPPNLEIWQKNSSFENIISYMVSSKDENSWIEQLSLLGTTSEDNSIVFNVQENYGNYNGFLSFTVNWYFCYEKRMNPNNINGFNLTANDVNLFYSPNKAFETEFVYTEKLEKISLHSVTRDHENAGTYSLVPGLDVKTELNSYLRYSLKDAPYPIETKSYITSCFSIPTNLETTLLAFANLRSLFKFLFYRTNVYLGDVDLFYINSSGKRDYAALLVFPKDTKQETHPRFKERLISFPTLQDKTAVLLDHINKHELTFKHLCTNLKSRSSYSPSRFIMIFSAFENEFRQFYGENNKRSNEYKEVKESIKQMIDEYSTHHTGKRKKAAREFSKIINNIDNSVSHNITFALKDCEEIMMPFIISQYKGSFPDICSDIGSRMGHIRNGIVHSKVNVTIDEFHLKDISILEQLLYAIRLKKIGIGYYNASIGIKSLFGVNVSVPQPKDETDEV